MCRGTCLRILFLLGLTGMIATTNAFLLPSMKQRTTASLYENIRNGGDDHHRIAGTSMRRQDTDDSSMRLPSVAAYWNSLALGVLMVATLTLLPPTADATYSAYTRREEDWQQRMSSGTIQVSNPKMLRDQLRAIAPMNDEGSFLFCPNGPSAAVSPLMENRCGDRQATPSVFGRSDDVLGNSIPGFSKDWMSTVSSASAADTGGLPEYGFTAGRKTK
jgi:hypothetical protein